MLYQLLLVAAAVVLAAVLGRRLLRRAVVYQHQRGLKYHRGQLLGVLEPGHHWYLPWLSRVEVLDVRDRYSTVAGQEVLSSDGVSLKVSLAATYRVADPAAAVNNSDSYEAALYLELQLALREIVGRCGIDEVLAQRAEMGNELRERVAPKAAALGLELKAVNLKDIMFPGALKQIFAQVAQARQQGLAALERARGETAALRHLANAAKLTERNPELMTLRVLQGMAESSGNTFVIGVPGAFGTRATGAPESAQE